MYFRVWSEVIYVCVFNTTLKSAVFLNKGQMYFTYSTVLLFAWLAEVHVEGQLESIKALCNYTCGGQTIWAILIWSQSIWRLWNLMSALFSDLSINSVTIGCAWSMHHFSRNDIHSRALFPSLPHFLKVGKAWDHPSHEWHQVGTHWVGPILS